MRRSVLAISLVAVSGCSPLTQADTSSDGGQGESTAGTSVGPTESATSGGINTTDAATVTDGGVVDGTGTSDADSDSGGPTTQTGAADSSDTGPPADWLEPYGFRKRIEVAATQADISDFVLAVILDADPQLAAAARPDGFDIAFTEADGVSRLAYERESYDGAGSLVAWVSVPLLSAAGSTDLYVYYGDPQSADSQDAASTWPAFVRGVWHLGDDGGGVYPDSGVGNTGTAAGLVAAAAGIAGGAVYMDGSGGEIAIGDPGDESLDFGEESFTYEVWVSADSSVGNFDMPWYKGGASAGNPGYDFELGAGAWRAGVSSDGTVVVGDFGDATFFVGTWTHLVAVVDRQAGLLRLYANGQNVDEDDIGGFGSLSTDLDARIARSDNYFFDGRIDEVRVSAGVSTSAWIAAQYDNLIDPAFVSVFAEEQTPGG